MMKAATPTCATVQTVSCSDVKLPSEFILSPLLWSLEATVSAASDNRKGWNEAVPRCEHVSEMASADNRTTVREGVPRTGGQVER